MHAFVWVKVIPSFSVVEFGLNKVLETVCYVV